MIDYRLLGNKNGIEVAIEILNKFPAAPILFITAFKNLQKEISENSIFYDKNVQVLLNPVKLDKIENAMVNLVNKKEIKKIEMFLRQISLMKFPLGTKSSVISN